MTSRDIISDMQSILICTSAAAVSLSFCCLWFWVLSEWSENGAIEVKLAFSLGENDEPRDWGVHDQASFNEKPRSYPVPYFGWSHQLTYIPTHHIFWWSIWYMFSHFKAYANRISCDILLNVLSLVLADIFSGILSDILNMLKHPYRFVSISSWWLNH